MYHLPKTQAVRERFRIAYPQYWLDKLMGEIQTAHKKTGFQGEVLTGQILAILKHPEAEIQTVIPGAGILVGAKKLGFVSGLWDWRTAKLVQAVPNIVTNDGDVYYAQLAMGDTITDDFQAAGAGLRNGSGSTAPVKTDTDAETFLTGTDHVIDATFPKSNDGDADNTGSGTSVMTWTYSYTTAQGNANGYANGGISDVRAGPSTAVLTHFLYAASFNKTSSDTLKVIVNHTVLGV